MIQSLGLQVFTAKDVGAILGQGSKILQVSRMVWPQKKERNIIYIYNIYIIFIHIYNIYILYIHI